MDIVGSIIEYEAGTLDADSTVRLFSDLVRRGTAWKLQGSYGRMAAHLIEAGILDHQGIIDEDVWASYLSEGEE